MSAILGETIKDRLANPKFCDFADWWLDKYAEKNLRERSIERFRQFAQRTYESFGKMKIKNIKAFHIQLFIDGLEEDGVNQRTGGGLSPKTVRGYLNFISDIFKHAWRLELIVSNPCERVILPKMHRNEPAIYSEQQIGEFLCHLKEAPIKYQAFYSIAIFSGLRRGELLGLSWNNIDFNNCIINVCKNLQYTKRKGMYFESPKTQAGCRVLKAPESLFHLIRRLRQDQLNYCKENGWKWSDDRTLFTNLMGEPMHPNTPYNWLKRFSLKCGLPFYGIHQFRHLNASLLINDGIDPRTVAYSLGHAQVSTTLNIYAHAFAYSQAKASQALGKRLEEKVSVIIEGQNIN